jgi:hypothetical protein
MCFLFLGGVGAHEAIGSSESDVPLPLTVPLALSSFAATGGWLLQVAQNADWPHAIVPQQSMCVSSNQGQPFEWNGVASGCAYFVAH